MSRPRSTMRIRLVDRKDSPCWYITYRDEKTDKQKQANTNKRKSDYSREMMLKFINKKTGVKETEMLSVLWFRDHTLFKLEGGRNNTIKNHRTAFKHLQNYFGDDYLINHINRDDILGFEDYMMKDVRLANSSINRYFSILSKSMQELYREDKVEANPFKRYHKHLREKKQKKTSLTKEETKKFLNVVINTKGNEDFKRLTRIYLNMGMRRTELLNIERCDVDLRPDKMEVKVINIKDGEQVKRTLEIPEAVWTDFNYFLNKYPNSSLPFKCCNPDYLSTWVKKRLIKADFSELHLHNTRHTFSTIQVENGTDIRKVSKYLGHKSVLTTELFYAHDIHKKVPALGL